jgi:hypothetical protein
MLLMLQILKLEKDLNYQRLLQSPCSLLVLFLDQASLFFLSQALSRLSMLMLELRGCWQSEWFLVRLLYDLAFSQYLLMLAH